MCIDEEETEKIEMSRCNHCRRRLLDWKICINCNYDYCFDCISWVSIPIETTMLAGKVEMKGHFCCKCEREHKTA